MKRSWIEFPNYSREAFGTETHGQWLQEFRSTKKQHWTELYRIDARGNLDMVSQAGWRESQVDDSVQLISNREWTLQIVNCLSPGLYRWIFTAIGPQNLQAVYRNTEVNSLSRGLYETVLMFCPATTWGYLTISIVMVSIVFWHGKSRFISRKRLIIWLAFTFCFSLVGLLTYFALNHTVVIRCPACGRKRSLEQDACPRCATRLPVPVPEDPHLIMN